MDVYVSGGTDMLHFVETPVTIYLDMNETDQGLRFASSTIFDTRNFFVSATDPRIQSCIANICFDLGEMARRDPVDRLEIEAMDRKSAEKIYLETLQDLRRTLSRFHQETRTGSNFSELKGWSDFVDLNLGVDNWAAVEMN